MLVHPAPGHLVKSGRGRVRELGIVYQALDFRDPIENRADRLRWGNLVLASRAHEHRCPQIWHQPQGIEVIEGVEVLRTENGRLLEPVDEGSFDMNRMAHIDQIGYVSGDRLNSWVE